MNYKKIYADLIKKRINIPANLQYNYTEKHHIIPRSINKALEKDPKNIVILSAREHFIAHALLVKIYKQRGDKTKWYKMVSAYYYMHSMSIKSSMTRKEISKSKSKLYSIWKSELSAYVKETKCVYNPSEGKYWITNIELKESKIIPNEESLPEGWLYGRISNFDKFLEKYNDALTKKEKWYFINYEKDIKENKIPRMLKNKKKPKEENKNVQKYLLSKLDTNEEKIKLLNEYFEEYKINGYKGVVKKFNYQYSRIALFKSFKKYLNDEYEEYKRLKYL